MAYSFWSINSMLCLLTGQVQLLNTAKLDDRAIGIVNGQAVELYPSCQRLYISLAPRTGYDADNVQCSVATTHFRVIGLQHRGELGVHCPAVCIARTNSSNRHSSHAVRPAHWVYIFK